MLAQAKYLWGVEQEALAAAILGVLVCPDDGLRLRSAEQGPAFVSALMYTACVAAICLVPRGCWVRHSALHRLGGIPS